jgi:small nuclear ribonucleoprotein (snRNP)-like protein
MNLVIDDAVEVKQATKTEGESRRELGMQIISIQSRPTTFLFIFLHVCLCP